jgi:hypothetical protein
VNLFISLTKFILEFGHYVFSQLKEPTSRGLCVKRTPLVRRPFAVICLLGLEDKCICISLERSDTKSGCTCANEQIFV